MNYFIEIFKDNQRLISFGLITFFFVLETFWPYLVKFENRTRHTARNVGLMLVFVVLAPPINYLGVLWFEYVDERRLGFLNLFQIPSILKVSLGLFLLDLGDYFYHRLSHKWKILWSYHRVHHSDHEMDVTTGYRFHPFENIGLLITQVITSFLFGYGIETVALYYTIYLPVVIVQHVNIRFPDWFENTFGFLFSTPNFHRVHHSSLQPLTDSNYGDLFCIWDRLLGTYNKVKPEELQFGLQDFSDDRKHTLWYMISAPFRK
jgi:sterol desaturase/sphingolipid hydroxylase (fatty acid hydroxylase superfamily)